MLYRFRPAAAPIALLAASLLLMAIAACDNSGGRTCDNQDDCFVGEACIDGFCVTDPSGDAGEADGDTVDDAGNDDTGDEDTDQGDGGTDDAESDTDPADAGTDATDDAGGNDAGIDTDPIQLCEPNNAGAGTPPPWLLHLGTTGTDVGRDVVVDSSGNAYVVGSYVGTLEIGDCTLYSAIGTLGLSTSSGLLVKLSPNGQVIWAKGFTDPEGARLTGVALNSADQVHVIGQFDGAVDLGGGLLENEDFGADGLNRPDIMVGKFDSDGAHLWSDAFNGDQDDRPGGIAVDGSDNVYVTGYFAETLTIGTSNLSSQTLGEDDVFLAKLDSAGDVRWATRYGGDDRDRANDIAADSAGNIYVIGEFEGTASLGTGELTSNDDSDDIFLAKYDTDGDPQWVEVFGGSGSDQGSGVAVDEANSAVIVTGGYRRNSIIGNQSMPYAQNLNIFAARFGTDGSFDWAAGYGEDRADRGLDVAVDNNGSIYVTGSMLSEIDFGGGDALNKPGGETVFVASFDVDANHRWSRAYGNFGEDSGQAVAVTGSGQTFVTGLFSQDFSFGDDDVSAAGTDDMFVVSIDP